MNGNWLLPEHLSDVLPAEARQIEGLRRTLLDLYRSCGFEMVAPPLVEYLDGLLAGAGDDLRLRTFKLVDQLSGRTLGVRADMTSQITRIDAHLLNRPGVTRLCYCGTTLQARPAGLLASREQWQIGAEVYGYPGVQADLEIIRLAAQTLVIAGVVDARLVLCHDGLVHAVLNSDPLAQTLADEIMALLRDKDLPGISELRLRHTELRPETLDALERLPRLYGGPEVLNQAAAALAGFEGVESSLQRLATVLDSLQGLSVSIDLADLGSYGYHSGITFSFYAPGWHDALVCGGRYDNVGSVYGRARPAVGFSTDLRRLARALGPGSPSSAVLAPASDDMALVQAVARLRAAGEIVVQLLPGESANGDEFEFDRHLVFENNQWVVQVRDGHQKL